MSTTVSMTAIRVNDATSSYTISVIDEDGNPVAYNAETNTFVMPAKEVWITVSSVTKNISYTSVSLDGRDSWDDSAYFYNKNNPTVTPTVTVMDGDKTLTEGTDYTVEIANNTGSPDNMVEAVVIVTGKGDYYSTNTKIFRITPFDIDDCELKGKFEAYDDGYGPYYPLSNNVEVWNGNTQLMCDTDYTIELDNNIDISSGYEIGEKYTATIYGTGDWGGTKTF